MARMIADGPARWYLQQHCGDLHFSICSHVHNLPDNVGDFLWKVDGIWRSSSADQQEALRQDEIPVVLGTLRAYPQEELILSADHFWQQLHTFELSSYDPNPYILEMIDKVLPGAQARYLQSRQAHETLHDEFFSAVQNWTVVASVVVIAIWVPLLWRQSSRRVIGLSVIVMFVVIANAAVTGILSDVDDRYQARVIWLLPLLAGVFVLEWLDRRAHRDPARTRTTASQFPSSSGRVGSIHHDGQELHRGKQAPRTNARQGATASKCLLPELSRVRTTSRTTSTT